MFKISNSLNNKVQTTVVFINKESKFYNFLNFFSNAELNQIALFSNELKEIKEYNFLKINLIDKNKKKTLIIFKISENVSEFEFQKLGGIVFDQICKFENVNILIENLDILKKNQLLFCSNFILGFYSKSYFFENYKLKKNKNILLKNLYLFCSNKKIFSRSLKFALDIFLGIKKSRDLVTLPANILSPKRFVQEILKLKKIGISVEVLNEKRMKKLGMNALLGVGQGSHNDSYLVIMKWQGNKSVKKKPLAFVGKGVCFDTGGISLKPASHMEDMKYDMSGAATVVGLMKTLALRKAKVNAVGIVGLVENMVDGKSQRPGDVVISYSKQSIEVLNTDAEGRLVLADAIAYTEDRFRPEFIVNLATLTGAIIVSLGNEYAGMFSNSDILAKQLEESGLKENEKCWRFPLHENYDRLMDSKIADLQNINYSGGAGSITAAQFLKRFIRKNTPWAHLDIAGMAWTKKNMDIIPEGATGYGVKLLNRLVNDYYEK